MPTLTTTKTPPDPCASHDNAPTDPPQEDHWLQLILMTHSPDSTANLLLEHGALGLEIQDHETYMEDNSIERLPRGQTRMIAYYPPDQPPEVLQATIGAALGSDSVLVTDYRDTSWRTKWQSFFKPVRLSPHCIVGPPWETFDPPTEWSRSCVDNMDNDDSTPVPITDGFTLQIMPGLAFGTGTHETTQLVSTLIDLRITSPQQGQPQVDALLDVGTGSGILSLLSKHLGVNRVLGIDYDPEAIRVAKETAAPFNFTNLTFSTTPVAEVDQTFPLVVANILEHILLSMRAELARVTAPGGSLIMSGVLATAAEPFAQHFLDLGLVECDRMVKNEWVAFHFTKP